MNIAAKTISLIFFSLIATRFLEYFAIHGSPIRPFMVYFPLLVTGSAICIWHARTERAYPLDRWEFIFFATMLAVATAALVSVGGSQPNSATYRIWPIANFTMAAIIFYFARNMPDVRKILTISVVCSACILLIGILADLWFPGLFAEWSPRPAGPPQNSNTGAMLLVAFIATLLPVKAGESPRIAGPLLAISALVILTTLSKSGLIAFLLISVCYFCCLGLSRQKYKAPRLYKLLVIFLLLIVATSVLFGPTTNSPDAIAIWRSRYKFSVVDLWRQQPIDNAPAKQEAKERVSNQRTTTLPIVVEPSPSAIPSGAAAVGHDRAQDDAVADNQRQFDESIAATDVTTELRADALRYYLNEAVRHPMAGQGSGFAYQRKVGPHNTFVGLAAEQGFAVAICYLLSLLTALLYGFKQRAPALVAISGVALFDSAVAHTVLNQPDIIVLLSMTMGLTIRSDTRTATL